MEKDVFLIKEISKDCKISMESIRKVSEYLGIKYFKNGRNFSINYDSYLQLEEFYKNHMTLDNLCRKCEVSFDWVRRRNNKIKFNPLVLGRFSFYDKKDEQILRNFLNENKYQPINNDKLAKFALSKYLKISRNRLNTLLNQLPPTEEQMFQFIWNEWLDGDIDVIHKEIIEDLNKYYDEVPPIENIDYKGFHDFAIEYCKYLSSLVSEKGSIKMEEVFDFIESYFQY